MISSRLVVLSLAVAGCTAALLAASRHARQLDKQVHKEALRAWEDEGGHLAPTKLLTSSKKGE